MMPVRAGLHPPENLETRVAGRSESSDMDSDCALCPLWFYFFSSAFFALSSLSSLLIFWNELFIGAQPYQCM